MHCEEFHELLNTRITSLTYKSKLYSKKNVMKVMNSCKKKNNNSDKKSVIYVFETKSCDVQKALKYICFQFTLYGFIHSIYQSINLCHLIASEKIENNCISKQHPKNVSVVFARFVLFTGQQ